MASIATGTSGTTEFRMTARDIVTTALEENAILPLGEQPEDIELQKCLLRLNGMVKSWQLKGVIWKQETISIDQPLNVMSFTLPDYVREVNGARCQIDQWNDRPMQRWERDDYRILPRKDSPGNPTMYYVEPSAKAVTLYVWPVPNRPVTYHLDIDRKMDAITDATQEVDIPDELLETVYSNLAIRCAGIFGVQPAQELAIRAGLLEQEMLDSYRPASYTMEPVEGPWWSY